MNKYIKPLIITAGFIIILSAGLLILTSPGEAFSLCDGCPLQEICSDTTEGVEILSCDNNAAAGAPAQMTNAALLINEEASADDTSSVSTVRSVNTEENLIQNSAVINSGEAVIQRAIPAAPEAAAAGSGDVKQSSVFEFSALNAYETTSETAIIITIKGGRELLEKFTKVLSDKYAIKDNKGENCELMVSTSDEITIKINKETAADKLNFIESHGIKIYR